MRRPTGAPAAAPAPTMDCTRTGHSPIRAVRRVARSLYERAAAGLVPARPQAYGGGVLVGWSDASERVFVPLPRDLGVDGIDEDALSDYLGAIEPEAPVDITVDLRGVRGRYEAAEAIAADLAAAVGGRKRVVSRVRRLHYQERRAARVVEYV